MGCVKKFVNGMTPGMTKILAGNKKNKIEDNGEGQDVAPYSDTSNLLGGYPLIWGIQIGKINGNPIICGLVDVEEEDDNQTEITEALTTSVGDFSNCDSADKNAEEFAMEKNP